MITWKNYEEYLMMHADGELRPEEEQELIAFVSKHPELKKEMAAYELTRLTPDTAQVFEDKHSLLKPLQEKRIIAFPQWRRYSIAAGVAALVFISLFKLISTERNKTEIAKTDSVTPIIPVLPAGKPEGAATPVVAKSTLQEPDSTLLAKHNTDVKPSVVKPANRMAVMMKVKKEKKHPDNTVDVSVALEPAINDLPLAAIKEMPYNNEKVIAQETKNVPVCTVSENNEEARKTLWDKLPLNDIKKKQFENIAGAVADVYNSVNTAKQNLYDKRITIDVKVEKRKLIISF